MANRLAGQTSPYLLQHADNPVDWRPWGPEALAEAQEANRPILLSVGYAACHWCHVMAHESFEDPDIARLMNTLFIPVKLDREERPDLDAIYQNALASMGQPGGWPLTMFLTPRGEPFWGGTYFPPQPRYGRPGFAAVLEGVARSWAIRPNEVQANVVALMAGLERAAEAESGSLPSLAQLNDGARRVLSLVDRRGGGLSGAPKFPQPGVFDFLWRAALRTGETDLAEAVIVTLDALCQGGIYDHLGGGFMRYSTDADWLVPHFEKMLYDNAQLVDLLTSVWQGTDRPLYRRRVAETVDWLLAEMQTEGGAFAATLDADSSDGEGAYYTWTEAEIAGLLDPGTAKRFAAAYDVTRSGNWEGRVILHRLDGGDGSDFTAARARLKAHRDRRPRPGRDDKVLADWNGMTIAALANAAFAFDRSDWLAAARTAYGVVRDRMALPGDRLAHTLCQGRLGAVGLLDDLAQMIRAAVTLAEVTGDAAFLHDSRRWAAAADRHHWDEQAGGYFQTAVGETDLIVRLKPGHDTATPSANGTMALALARLGQMTGETAFLERAEATAAAFAGETARALPSCAALLAAVEQLAAPVEITVSGTEPTPLLAAVAGQSLPTRVLWHGGAEGPAHAVICRGQVCLPPVADPQRLRQLLNER